MQRDDIRKLGAQAAREGLDLLDCPYYVASAMPGHTGEAIQEWREKVDAWEAGWVAETESRKSLGSARPSPRSNERRPT